MGRRLRTVLDLTHPDISKKVQDKQDKGWQEKRSTRSFTVGEKLYAQNFSGSPRWLPVIVTKITGPVSYHVKTQDGIVLRRHTDQLRPRLGSAELDNNEENELLDSADECDDFSIPDIQPIPAQDPPQNHPPDPPQLPPAPPIRRSVRSRRTVDHGPFVRSN